MSASLLLALGLMALDPASQPVGAYQGGQPGSVELIGRVVLATLPAPRKFSVKRNADKCGREKADVSVLYSGDGGLANVVVWLEGVKAGKDAPKDMLTLKNITCTYEPRVATAVLGTTLEIKNYDGVQMIAFGLLQGVKTPFFQTTLPVKGLGYKRKLEAAGIVNVHSDAEQPWANAWVHVFEHPYATVSDEGGYFSMDKVPDGAFVLHAWHETLGDKKQPLNIKADPSGARARADLRYE